MLVVCHIKSSILTELEDLCKRVNAAFVLTKNKLQLNRNGICPCLSWLLSVCDLPLTWIERHVEPIATWSFSRNGVISSDLPMHANSPVFQIGDSNLSLLSTLFKNVKCLVTINCRIQKILVFNT